MLLPPTTYLPTHWPRWCRLSQLAPSTPSFFFELRWCHFPPGVLTRFTRLHSLALVECSERAELPRFAMAPGASLNDAIPIDLTDTRRPPRRATIRVQAWPQQNREAAVLELATVEGTQDALQARLDEAGYGSYRLCQMHGKSLDPDALYSLVNALQPKPPRTAKSPSSGGAAASSSPVAQASWRATPQVPPRQRRPRERIMLTVNPSFDLLAKVIAPEFTMAQGVKE